MITANAFDFWNTIAKSKRWREYILPKRTDAEFDREGELQSDAIRAIYPGGVAVDYGCGIGRISKHMAKHSDRMIGLDICADFIRRAKEIDSESEYYLIDEFTECGIADLVYSVSVMQHNTPDNAERIMRDIHRLLRPGGRCFVTFAHGPAYTSTGFVRKFDEAEIQDLARGFTDVRIIKSNLVHYGGYTIPKGEANELILMASKA